MADSPVSFGTDGWRASGDGFRTERVRAIGRAVATHLDERGPVGPVAVGYDARERSHAAATTLTDTLTAATHDVTLADRDCPTPTLAWTVATGSYAGGLVVTASHNPAGYNGVKILTAEGMPALPATTDALERRLATQASDPPDPPAETTGQVEERNLREPYVEHLLDSVGVDLSGLTVAYDAMHGSGRAVTDTALERSGATVRRHRCSRDPTFGGVAPEPGPDTAEAVRAQVEGTDSDLGLLNDGDADRVGVVTPGRGYLDANLLLAVLYEFLLERGDAGAVVRTVATSSLVDRVASAAGRSVHETPVGFKWVAEAMVEHAALVGGEESGGYGLTQHLPNKDGVLVALLACAAHRERPLDDRIARLLATHGPVHQGRESVATDPGAKSAAVTTLRADPPDSIAGSTVTDVSTVDGVKFSLADGTWLLVRPSGTEPKLRLYAEADAADRVEDLLAAGRELL